MIRCLCLIVLTCFALCSHAQTRSMERCGTQQFHEQKIESDPDYKKRYKDVRKSISDFQNRRIACDGTNTISIPLAFHFEAALSLSCDDQLCMLDEIMDQIAALNIGFGDNTGGTNLAGAPLPDIAGCTAYTGIISTGSCIEFCLASPPAGNDDGLGAGDPPVTFGVYSASGASAPSWTNVINIFIGDCGGGILGFSPLPGSANGDGICMAASSFGGPSASAGCGLDTDATFGLGATLVHEMGHYLGLEHTWENGGGGGCGDGDGIADTPDGDDNPFFGCPIGPGCATNTCGDIQASNFMDYTDDACMGIFTEGQAAVMNGVALGLFGTGAGGCVADQAPASLAQCLPTPPAACPVATDLVLDNLADGDVFCTNEVGFAITAIETSATPYIPGFEISWADGTWGGEIEAVIVDGCDGGSLTLPQGSFGTGNPSGGGSQDLTYWSPSSAITITLTDANFADDSEILGLTITDRLCGNVLFGPLDTGTGLTTTPLVITIPAGTLSGGVLMSGPGVIEDGCSQAFALFDPATAGAGTHDICIDYAGVDCDGNGDFTDAGDCEPVQQCISITVVQPPEFDLATVDLMCSSDGTTYDVSITLNYDAASAGSIAVSATGGTLAPAALSGTGSDVLIVTGIPSGSPFTIDVDDTGASDCDTNVGATFTCLDCAGDAIAEISDGDEFCSDDAAVSLSFPKSLVPDDITITINVVDGGTFASEQVGVVVLADAAGNPDLGTPGSIIWEIAGGVDAGIADNLLNGDGSLACNSVDDGAGGGIAGAVSTIVVPGGTDFFIILLDEWGDGWGANAEFTMIDNCGNLLADETALDNDCGSVIGPISLVPTGTFSGPGVSLLSDPDGILGNGDESWEYDPALAGATGCETVEEDIVFLYQDQCGAICDIRATPIVYPPFDATTLVPVVGDCVTAPSLTSTCANYTITLDADADDITSAPAAGESGTNNYTITWTGGPACFEGTATVVYDCPAAACPVVTTAIAGTEVACTGVAPVLDDTGLVIDDASLAVGSGTVTWWTDSALTTAFVGTLTHSGLDNCVTEDVTLYASIECASDNTIIAAGSIVVTVYPAFDATLLLPVTGDCATAPSLTSTCANYVIALDGDADDISAIPAPGDGGVNDYTITWTGAPACWSGSAQVAYNCGATTVSISDPCACNNDGTDAITGTFTETVEIMGDPGATWAIVTVSGANGLAAGATFTETPAGSGTYLITFTHDDNIGYFMEVNDGINTLFASNVCQYPDPSFVVEASYCSEDVTDYDLTTLIADATLPGQTGHIENSTPPQPGTLIGVMVDGVPTTTFNPNTLGVGTYSIVAMFDGSGMGGNNTPGGNATDAYAGLVDNGQAVMPIDSDCIDTFIGVLTIEECCDTTHGTLSIKAVDN